MNPSGAQAAGRGVSQETDVPVPGADGSLRSIEVAVLFGGASGEREVSLQSGAEIARSLMSDDGRGPARVRQVELCEDGSWRFDGRSVGAARALEELGEVDVFFLALHGGAGEDGTLQGLFAASGRLHTGSGVAASALCMDKQASRALARELGLTVAPGLCLGPDEPLLPARLEELGGASGWAVKPRRGGSSVATFVLAPGEPLEPAVAAVRATGDDCLIEAAVAGVEVSCGVLGNPGEELRALPPIEIQPAQGRFFDYEQKYSPGGARECCPPESLTADEVAAVRTAARRFYVGAGCAGYARVDFIVPPGGAPVLLEANTLPGFTARSLLPQEALQLGLDHRDLCLFVVQAALARARSAR